VVIEHSKDVHTAVEVVLVEIIPNLPAEPLIVGSSSNSKSSFSFFEGIWHFFTVILVFFSIFVIMRFVCIFVFDGL